VPIVGEIADWMLSTVLLTLGFGQRNLSHNSSWEATQRTRTHLTPKALVDNGVSVSQPSTGRRKTRQLAAMPDGWHMPTTVLLWRNAQVRGEVITVIGGG
jgi:hypothetical protein